MKNREYKNLEDGVVPQLVAHLKTLTKGMSAIDEHMALSLFSRWIDIRINNLSDEINED